MPSLPFAALTQLQQAQATRIFQDASFGTDPNSYAYELEAATGQLSGQRSRGSACGKKIQSGKRSPLSMATLGKLQISNQAAHILARMILPDCISNPTLIYSIQRWRPAPIARYNDVTRPA